MADTNIPVTEVDLGAGISAFYTNRCGGYSREQYSALNLGSNVGDTVDAVQRNRGLVKDAVGADVLYLNQVHGNVVVDAETALLENPEGGTDADGVTYGGTSLGLAVYVADCVPVLLADPVAGQIAVAHAGRPGLVSDVIGNTVRRMVRNGSRVADIRTAVGPCICATCYEVPADMAIEFEHATGASVSVTAWGTPGVDLRAAAHNRLVSSGVTSIQHVRACTYESAGEPDGWFSHRWATHNLQVTGGKSGRFAGVIRRTSAEV